ncbi:hypothetical protein NMY22_g11440 [Coprinellus aureogranulatus]|nr:hypothetical protein NMY22_g11440 [Coprinellus aureogranulatus]
MAMRRGLRWVAKNAPGKAFKGAYKQLLDVEQDYAWSPASNQGGKAVARSWKDYTLRPAGGHRIDAATAMSTQPTAPPRTRWNLRPEVRPTLFSNRFCWVTLPMVAIVPPSRRMTPPSHSDTPSCRYPAMFSRTDDLTSLNNASTHTRILHTRPPRPPPLPILKSKRSKKRLLTLNLLRIRRTRIMRINLLRRRALVQAYEPPPSPPSPPLRNHVIIVFDIAVAIDASVHESEGQRIQRTRGHTTMQEVIPTRIIREVVPKRATGQLLSEEIDLVQEKDLRSREG